MLTKLYRLVLYFVMVFPALVGLRVSTATAQSDYWEQLNGPFGGVIEALEVNVQGDIFAVTWGPHVFRSTDNGVSWSEVSPSLNRWVLDLVFSQDGNIIVSSAEGLFRSANNGDSWEPINDTLAQGRTWDMGVNSNGDIFVSSTYGLIRSVDHGVSWTVLDTSIAPRDFAFNSKSDIFAAEEGVVRSADNGSTWTTINTGLPTETIAAIAVNSRDDVFVATGGMYPYFSPGSVFRSTDNGDNWTLVNSGLNAEILTAISINTADEIFASSLFDGFFRSVDNGESWSQVNGNLNGCWASAIAFNSANDLLVGTYGSGIMHSQDSGDSWLSTNEGMNAGQIRIIGRNGPGDLFVGTGSLNEGLGGTLFRSSDDGDSWIEVGTGLPPKAYFHFLSADGAGNIFIGANWEKNGGIFRSQDNGDTWNQVSSNQTRAFVFSSNGEIYAGGDGILRSSDGGDSWTRIPINLEVDALAINSVDEMFAVEHDRVFRISADGTAFQLLDNLPSGGLFHTLEVHPDGDIFAMTLFSDNDGLFHSSDNGDLWSEVSSAGCRPTALTIDASGNIYVAGREGVYVSSDKGVSWSAINVGIEGIYIQTLATTPGGEVLAGTYGNGLFRLIRGVTAVTDHVSELPSLYALKQNYPNPFNPDTEVRFQLSQTSDVQIRIYDLMGAEIRLLVDDQYSSGDHGINWDGRDNRGNIVPSGLYLYRLQAGEFTQVNKMTVLR